MFSLYVPILISLAAIWVFIKIHFGMREFFSIEKYGYKVIVTQNMLGKFAVFSVILSFLPNYLFMDFSKLFPKSFVMEVFYDTEGIAKSVSSLSKETLKDIGYDNRNVELKKGYYLSLDNTRAELTGRKDNFFASGGRFYSEGSTDFTVVKINGIQRYKVANARGRLKHTLIRMDGTEESFISFFERIPSAGDFIEPTIKNIFFDRSITIHPEFKQSIATYGKEKSELVDHTLLGVTRITLWPFPEFSNTVYFYRYNESTVVPVAYAIYE